MKTIKMKNFVSNIIKHIQNRLERRKAMKIQKKYRSQNPKPTTFRMWEHNGWGDKIAIRSINTKHCIIHIVGWLPKRPQNGDVLIYQVEKGRYAKGVIYNVELLTNPHDMFFADVKPIEEINL